jgi:Fe-S cluster biogenesis protein NfuA
MTNEELYEKVSQVIDKDVKLFIEADGGKIKLRKIENGIVYVELSGACAGCPGVSMTLRGGVERILKMQIEAVESVRLAY